MNDDAVAARQRTPPLPLVHPAIAAEVYARADAASREPSAAPGSHPAAHPIADRAARLRAPAEAWVRRMVPKPAAWLVDSP